MKKSSTKSLISPLDYKSAKSKHGRAFAKKLPQPGSDEYLAWRLQNDPGFYQKKLLKIVTKGQLKPLEPRYHQQILINIVRALRIAEIPVRIIVLKARRLGFSTEIEAMGTQETTTQPFRKAKVVAHTSDAASEIFSMTRTFYDELPKEFRPMTRYSSRTELLFENPKDETRPDKPGLRSKFTVATAGGKGIGRGEEVTFLHLSEAGFYENASELATGLLQTVDYLPDTSIFIESTANGSGNWFHDQYWNHKEGKEELIKSLVADHADIDKLVSHLESYQGTVGYIPLFFPWHEFADYQLPISSDAEREYVKKNLTEEEQELVDLYDLSLEQLKWRKARLDELARTSEGIPPLDLFRQEYPASDREAFIATGRTLFDPKKLGEMKTRSPLMRGRFMSESNPRTSRKRPYSPKFLDHPFGELAIYAAPKNGHQYAIGVDVAFAEKGRDFCCMEVLDKTTLEHCAEWHGKGVDPDELGRFGMMLGRFYNDATVAIERNNMGIGALIALRDTGYSGIYMPKTYAQQEENPLDRLGWETTRNSKALAISTLAELIRKGRINFNSEGLISECLSFKVDESGRMGAEEGRHDDRVMAMAICAQVTVDYPPKKEYSTLQQILNENDLERVLVSEKPAHDPEYGDILP